MIYTPMTKRAMTVAYQAHHGQLDKSGVPYILHPAHLAEQMDDEISCTVALLHDTVEDTDITLDALGRDFPAEVVEAVKLLTQEKGADYFEYIRAIRANPIAVKVKLADLAHNGDMSRCVDAGISEERMAAWQVKYAKARKILTESGERNG